MRFTWLILPLLLASPLALPQQTPPPVLFFTDLTNGPATGNPDSTYSSNGGVYVALYGNYLNSPTVTLNGASCLKIVLPPTTWLWYQKMVVQLTSTCSSGNFVVTTSGGTSNALPFTVRSGGIYYVSNSGNDSTGTGSFSSPWATMSHAVQSAQPPDGRIIYVENGVATGGVTDSGGWGALTFRMEWSQPSSSGYASAILTYPGATATIGSASYNSEPALAATDNTASNGAALGWWTIAGFTIRDGIIAASLHGPTNYPSGGSENWRLIGNDMSCPGGNGSSACFHTDNLGNTANNNKFFGNYIHDSGTPISGGPDDQYHGMYLGDQSRHYEVGWNLVSNIVGCRGIQVYSNYQNEFDYQIHDNTIHDTTCDGIVAATSNPSQGGIYIYNNVIFRTGIGPQNTSEGGGNFSGIFIARTLQTGSAGSGTTYVYNNSIYDTGEIKNLQYSTCGSSMAGIALSNDNGVGGANTNEAGYLQNNSIYELSIQSPCGSGIPYWFNDEGGSYLTGSTNLTYGLGCSNFPCTSAQISNSVTANPNLVNTSETGCPSNCVTDMHLQSGSPAIGAGSLTGLNGVVPASTLVYDHDGLVRPSSPSIGAYEYASASAPSRPNPPINLTVVIVTN
jgi:hypothetical protein